MSDIPDECPVCGNEDIETRRDVGVYKWNWTCDNCMNGDCELKKEYQI